VEVHYTVVANFDFSAVKGVGERAGGKILKGTGYGCLVIEEIGSGRGSKRHPWMGTICAVVIPKLLPR